MRVLIATTAVVALSFGAAACSEAEEIQRTVETAIDQASETAAQVREQAERAATLAQFCTAALRTADAVNSQDWDAAIQHGETMVAEAPDDIEADAQIVLDGAKAYRDGDQQAVMSEEFQAAAERVKTYARDSCDPSS